MRMFKFVHNMCVLFAEKGAPAPQVNVLGRTLRGEQIPSTP